MKLNFMCSFLLVYEKKKLFLQVRILVLIRIYTKPYELIFK